MKRVLDPVDRVSEVLFGLIMVLGVTGSLSVAQAGRADVRAMLAGALGCNLAWGLIDGTFYLMDCLAEKGRSLATYEAVRTAADPQEARQRIADALPSVVAAVLQPAELEAVRQRLRQLPEPPAHARLSREDWLGGVSVSLLVFASTLPVAIPFILMDGAVPALRVSSGIAITMLFGAGYEYGRRVGRRPWMLGIATLLVGVLLAGLTIALGG